MNAHDDPDKPLDVHGSGRSRTTAQIAPAVTHVSAPDPMETTTIIRRTTASGPERGASRRTTTRTPQIAFSGFGPIDPLTPPDFNIGISLGAGGMGSVYTASQVSMNRPVAVKRSHETKGSGSTYDSVRKEGMLFGRLDHPNIPPVHMVGEDPEGHAVLVMKLIEGTDLHSLVRNPSHARWNDVDGDPSLWLLDVFIQVTHAVEHAHSKNVLHRDIKTENIMVGDFGQVFLIDWGIAIDLNNPSAAQTTGKFIGTPCFAAPEMVEKNVTLDARTDVYLLGAMLLEMVSGSVMFKGRTLQEIIERVRANEREDVPVTVPNALTSIILKATAHDREERYPSAKEFRAAVHRYKSDRHHYQNIAQAEGHLDTLESWLFERRTDSATGYRFMTLAHESLALLKAASRAGVAPELTGKLLVRNLKLQAQYAIITKQFGVAKALVSELIRETGSDAPWVIELADRITEEERKVADRESELQIQTNLMMIEKLHSLQQQVTNRTPPATPMDPKEPLTLRDTIGPKKTSKDEH